VSLGVAKDQRLSLNPTQISGACGRLMCSLRYEHEFYVQARRRFPKEGKTVRTSLGEERVVSNDIFRERVVLRNTEGETRTIPLGQLLQESEAVGGTITPAVLERIEPAKTPPDGTAWGAERETRVDRNEDTGIALDEDAEGELSVDVVADPPAPAQAEQPAPSERRPHRRRGRRGGRRNRGGRRDGGGPAKSGGPE
jgi:hypothetical protein